MLNSFSSECLWGFQPVIHVSARFRRLKSEEDDAASRWNVTDYTVFTTRWETREKFIEATHREESRTFTALFVFKEKIGLRWNLLFLVN